MMMPIAFVHGIESDGSKSTDLLMAKLKDMGHECIECDYDRVHWWNAGRRGIQLDRAQTIFDRTRNGYHLVGHSFGGVLARRAMQLGREFGHVFLFSPADSSNTYYTRYGMESLTVIFNQFDRPLKWGALFAGKTFGRLGQFGYSGGARDERIKSVQDPYYRLHVSTHSHYFQNDRIEAWAKYIDDKISIHMPVNPPVVMDGLPFFPQAT
jgi:pimeloyl-ACP methyl ester carboxylesterase